MKTTEAEPTEIAEYRQAQRAREALLNRLKETEMPSPGLKVDRVQKVWGREIILHDGEYCCKLLQYDGIRTSSEHYHETKHETFVVLKGLFEISWYMLDNVNERQDAARMGPGACIVLAPRTVHLVKCLSPDGGTIVEASSKEDPDDCVRLTPSVNPFGR